MNNWLDDEIGLIKSTLNNEMKIIKYAKIIKNENYDINLNLLKKGCLKYLLNGILINDDKSTIIKTIIDSLDKNILREKYKEILFCKEDCKHDVSKCKLMSNR